MKLKLDVIKSRIKIIILLAVGKSSGSFVSVLALSPHFNGLFPGGSGFAGTRMSPFWILLELMMMERELTTGALR